MPIPATRAETIIDALPYIRAFQGKTVVRFDHTAWNVWKFQFSDGTAIAIEAVKKLGDQVGFVVLPRRWVVERFFAWINRNRRLAKDFEATVASAETFLYAASVMLLTRRLARSK